RPTDKATIDYLIDVGRVLSGEAERTNDDKSDLLTNIIDALDLTKQQLEKCIGKNIRITARRIMKAKYPSPVIGFKFADVDKDHISAARGQALHQREANTIDLSRAIDDDIIDVSTISVNESIDYLIDDNPISNTSTFLNDAILEIEQIKCNTSSIVTEKDIACALILLKKRHRLSARSMADIISLLRTLSVKNVPSSWYKLKRTLTDTISSPVPSFICLECEGVWPGPKKPTRTEMSLFLRPLIDELLNLERGEYFDFHDQDNNAITARVFLIGACCDKPAQVLLQFLPDSTAAFGCGRCEVKGFMGKTAKDGNVRSFATTCADLMEIQKRSNMRFDVLLYIKLLHDQLRQSLLGRIDKSLMMQHKIEEKGITGPCIFRELSYFEVGNGFMADSLHNVYIGAFLRCVASLPK
ncbi:unnamed protein product, partial [Rotaria magnacalcarata]